VERWALERMVPFAHNARTHSAAQIDQIAASIREWGWTNPVLVDEPGTIIARHDRVEVARKLGLSEAPVMVAAGWSEAKKRAYVISDNKLALNAGCDEELLAAELSDLKDLAFDLDVVGFDAAELGKLLGANGTAAGAYRIPARLMLPVIVAAAEDEPLPGPDDLAPDLEPGGRQDVRYRTSMQAAMPGIGDILSGTAPGPLASRPVVVQHLARAVCFAAPTSFRHDGSQSTPYGESVTIS
jgi:hypothetical protein